MNNNDSNQLLSASCPPCSSDDSIFFNLILRTSYENTKENCLIFLKNYSQQILYSKRDIFKIIINELTFNQYSNKMINNNESIYLIRQFIKKYSRNNILNALYEFISEKENEKFPLIGNKNNNNCNCNDEFSMNNNENSFSNEEGSNNNENEKGGNDELNEINRIKRNNRFLAKKRKPLCTTENGKKLKKINNKKKEDEKQIINKENKESNRNINIKNEGEQLQKKDINDEEMREEGKKQNEKKEQEFNEEKKNNKIKNEDINIIKKEEKNEYDEKKEKKEKNNENNKEEENKEIEKNIKKDIIIEKEENKVNYINKSKIISLNKSKSYSSIISKSANKENETKINHKRFFSAEEFIKLESSNELILNNSMSISSNFSINSKKINNQNNLDDFLYFNIPKQQINYFLNENEFVSHLIKNTNQNNFVYSYKLKKFEEEKNKIIHFECNNRKCKGKGVYDVDNKIFKETEEHNLSINCHKLASKYNSAKINLLNDNECNGYQLLKNKSFIKDKKVIMIK